MFGQKYTPPMKTIDRLLEIVPNRNRVKFIRLLKQWEKPAEEIAMYVPSDYHLSQMIQNKINTALQKAFNVNYDAVISKNSKRAVVDLRKIIAYYLKNNGDYSLSEVAMIVGIGNHTTVMHYCKKHEEHLQFDPVYKEKNDKFLKAINHDNESNNSARAENENTITTTLDILRHRVYNS